MAAAADARVRKTRRALADAILELASHRDVDELTVSEVAAAAGISRITFYRHADSPGQLLCRVLTDELDALRERGTTMAVERRDAVFREVLIALARHLESYEPIYRESTNSVTPALSMLLTEHVEHSLLALIDESATTPGTWHANQCFVRRASAAHLAHGIVGLLEAWLDESAPRDPELLLIAIDELAPPWWRQLDIRLAAR